MNASKGFKECATCVNREYDPFQCKKCENGDRWESDDDEDEDTLDDLRAIIFKEVD